MKIKYKFWFENERGYIFGKGSYELLKRISLYKNIKKAAEDIGMSYRHAWGIINEIEEKMNVKLIESHRGGKEGGMTILTPQGIKMIEEYEKYEKVFKYVSENPYLKPSLTVDAILYEDGKILLIKRKNPPFKDYYALPGGFVEYGETVEHAVVREMEEETSLRTEIIRLIGVYSDPKRDPRGHTISIVFELRRKGGKLKGGDDAISAAMFPVSSLPSLAFDHAHIIQDYLGFIGRI